MTDFDPVKAAREEIAGLTDVHKVIRTHVLDSERKLAEMEAEHNAFLKMDSLMVTLLEGARATLRALEERARQDESTS